MKNSNQEKNKKRENRKRRAKSKVFGFSERPRLAVFRSNAHIYAQIIDDKKGKTLVSASDLDIKSEKGKTKTERAMMVGELIATRAKELKISGVVFYKGSFRYHGRVKALAEGSRKGGLKF